MSLDARCSLDGSRGRVRFLADRNQIDRRVGQAVQVEEIIDPPIVETANIDAAQAEADCRQVDILRDVPRLYQDEAIATVSILEGGASEKCSDENNHRRVLRDVLL